MHAYLTFENPAIAGSGTAAGHVGEIEVLSWSHGYVQPTSPAREQAGHQDFRFTKYMDASTNDLLTCAWSGQEIGKVTLRCYRDDSGKQALFLTVQMEHVIVSDFAISGGAGDVPIENVKLDYGTIKYTYLPANGAPEEASAVRRP